MASTPITVAIIGGGPVGLASSILLSLRGIPHALFERHSGTAIHPKACGVNQRTNEIFRIMGIEQDVYANCAPSNISGRTAWYTGLGPDQKEIFSRDAWGGGEYAEEYEKHSPSRYCMLPQIRLEPILKRRATELNPGGVKFGAKVLTMETFDDEAVSLTVRYSDKEVDEKIRARFVICADGGNFTEQLGVEWLGQKSIFGMVTAHFKSPLNSLHPDPRNYITWFLNAENEGSVSSGAIYPLGPWPTPQDGREEWSCICGIKDTDPEAFNEASIKARVEDALKIPGVPIEILSLSHWDVNAIYASRYRVGRVFLVGDAAHKIPPWGALGMNTGIQDAHNLVWKLGMALKDEKKYQGLLDSYDTERRPVGRDVGLSSLNNILSHRGEMDTALGMSDKISIHENRRALDAYFDEAHPEYHEKRQAVAKASTALDSEFKAPGNEVGWFYPSADINNEGGRLHGGQLTDSGAFNQTAYHASTIPGHHLPHCWVERSGQKVALRDLIPLNKLLLLTMSPGWKEFENNFVSVEQFTPGKLEDTNGDWLRQCGVSKEGAVLVRPDGIVAWRGERGDESIESWPRLLERILYLGRRLASAL